jgi:predicted RNA-binding Zn ribbon-like protein
MGKLMTEINTHAGNLRLVGGRLVLDFVNTVDCYTRAEPKDYLRRYTDLVIWGQHVDILTADTSRQLLQEAARRSTDAELIFTRAIALRWALYQIFSAAVDRRTLQTADLATVNITLAAAPTRSRIVQTSHGGYSWSWNVDANALDQILWPVVWSAADVLTSTDVARVGQCSGDRCTWLFLDTSHNHSRRWCYMQDCGNRAKARRHYQRHSARAEGERVTG